MNNYLRKIIPNIKRKLGISPRIIKKNFAGKLLEVREFSFSDIPDYDDAWIFACCRNAKQIFDVGANIGKDILYAMIAKSDSHVFAIEANKEALIIASDHVIRNHFCNRVSFINFFVGKKDEQQIKLWTVGSGSAGSVYKQHATTAAKLNSYQNVNTITIDTLSKTHKVVPDFIKIDVEGAEYDVLRGACETVKSNQTRILIEMHSNPAMSMKENAENVLKWAVETAYSCWYLKEGRLLTNADEIVHRGRCHLLFQPKSWPYPDWLKSIHQSDPVPEG